MAEYRLLKRHRLNGVWQEPGHEFSMPSQTGDWLVGQGVSQPILVVVKTAQVGKSEGGPVVVRSAPTRALRQQVAAQSPRFSCCGWGGKK